MNSSVNNSESINFDQQINFSNNKSSFNDDETFILVKSKGKNKRNINDVLTDDIETNNSDNFKSIRKIKPFVLQNIISKQQIIRIHVQENKYNPNFRKKIATRLDNSVITTIESTDIKCSTFRISENGFLEKETLNSLRSIYPMDYLVCIWYLENPNRLNSIDDTQFGLTESPKINEKNISTAHRGIYEELSIDVKSDMIKPISDSTHTWTFVDNNKKITRNTCRYILDLTNSNDKIINYGNLQKIRSTPDLKSSTAIKAMVMVLGTQELLVDLLKVAQPNDNIKGYHLIPISNNILDTMIN